jgi:glutathione S-transferase
MTTSSVRLHGLPRSVYTRIARLALEEKGVPYELHEVEIFGAGGVPTEHLARHPFGRIPVLEHDGFWLYETAAITRYIDEAFDGPPLQPSGARERARLNQLIGALDAYGYRPMVWGVFVERVGASLHGSTADETKIAEGMAASRVCLDALAAIADCAPYLLGAQLTLADLHAYPMLRYFALAPEGHELLAGYAPLTRWFDTVRMRDSVRRTSSAYESERSRAG